MTQLELKEKLYDLVCEHFALLKKRGNIIWGRSKAVYPGSPLVVIYMTNIQRPFLPTREYINGIINDNYPISTILSVDLVSHGEPVTDEPNIASQNKNTAVSELLDFANFINSVYVDNWCNINNISLRVRAVQDLTAIINDNAWQYRALLEIDVGFIQTASGYTAHDNKSPK